jgi:heme/copper-type cytochrome/quinol oxidase subunit 2
MEEDMNGFRNGFGIWTAADNRAFLHTKRRAPTQSKTAPALLLAVGLLLSMTGCGKKTPTFAGPPDTVRQIVMKKWEIVPNRLEIPQGARVELVVTSTDVEHGIAVPGLGINEPVQPEHPAVIRFLAQAPGTYPMHCSVLCGRGHNKMTGVIVIVPHTNR